MPSKEIDFFVSYNSADKGAAEWLAYVLEGAGYRTVIQAWDFRPGNNFVLAMQQALADSEKIIPVLSPDYLGAKYTHAEWAAVFAVDPLGVDRLLIPVMVRECEPIGLLRPIVYIKLFDLDEEAARGVLLDGVRDDRGKPSSPPPFFGTKP